MKKMILSGLFLSLMAFVLMQGFQVRELGAGSGESIAQERCTACHGIGRVERAGHDRARWISTVRRMMGKSNFGPKLSDAEFEALIEYLVSI